MNERIKELAEQARLIAGNYDNLDFKKHLTPNEKKFAELIIKDMANELFVVYPGGKRDSNVEFQNISMRQWIKQVYGVDV
jgi:hypothetical protein